MATKGGQIDPGAYEKAAKAAKLLLTTQQGINKHVDSFQNTFNSITSIFTEISGSEFFDKIAKTPEDIQSQIVQWQQLQGEISKASQGLQQDLGAVYDNFAKRHLDQIKLIDTGTESIAAKMKVQIGGALSDLDDSKIQAIYNAASSTSDTFEKISTALEKQGISLTENSDLVNEIKLAYEDIQEQNELREKSLEKIVESQDSLRAIADDELRAKTIMALKNQELPALLNKISSIEREQILAAINQQNTALGGQVRDYTSLVQKGGEFKTQLDESTKSVFNLSKGLKSIGDNILKQAYNRLFEFDEMLHKVQMNSGIDMVNNATKMTALTVETAKFGMSVGETGDMMEKLGDELKTVDFDLISGAVSDFAAISKATGASAESITIIAGEMMRAGASSQDVKDAMAGANVAAQQFGVSAKQVIESLSKNLDKMRQFGFTGGIESLTKMTAMAERLRFNVDEIFNVAKRARTIEGAMEMSAELQLAAGSFANINPMDLLAASRKGPEELGKILTKMGADIGKFNQETGQYEFDPVDIDRLQIVAEATGMELDSIQKMIQKNAEDNKKLEMFPTEMFNVGDLDPDAVRSEISDAMEFDTDKGEWVIKGDNIFGAKSISDLQGLTDMQISSAMEQQKTDSENLEKQAQENMALKESWDNLISSLVNMFTIFQPVLEWLGQTIQWLTDTIGGKVLIGLTVGLFAFSKAIPMFLGGAQKFITAMNPSNWKGIFKAGGLKSFLGQKSVADIGGPKGDAGGQISKLAQTTKKVPPGTGLKGFMTNLAAGLRSFGKGGAQVLKGAGIFALTLLMVGGSLALIAAGFSALGGDPLVLLAMGAAIVGLAFSFNLMSKAAKGINVADVMKMSLAMLIMGAAMVPFAISAVLMSDVDWASVLGGIVILTAVIFGLMGLGMLMAGPQMAFLALGIGILLGVSVGLLMFGAGMLMIATSMEKLQGIDVSNIGGIAMAMMDLIPAMMGLALAGLMFANPITLLGFALMLGSMMGLAAVLIPISQALEMGADALSKMASGVMRLSDALSKLDLEKMRELSDISKNMAQASSSAKMAEAMAQFSRALKGNEKAASGGGGTARKGGDKLVVQLVLPNGRILKEQEIKDIEIVS